MIPDTIVNSIKDVPYYFYGIHLAINSIMIFIYYLLCKYDYEFFWLKHGSYGSN